MTGINVKKNKSKIRGYALSKLLLFCALIVAIGSCKKDGDTGPQGVAGPTGTPYNYKQGALIQGNFSILVDAGDNSTGNSATVSGSFQSIAVTEYVSRINPETETSHLVRY